MEYKLTIILGLLISVLGFGQDTITLKIPHGFCSYRTHSILNLNEIRCTENTSVDIGVISRQLLNVADRYGYPIAKDIKIYKHVDFLPAYSLTNSKDQGGDITNYIVYLKEYYEKYTDNIIVHYIVLGHEIGHHIDYHIRNQKDNYRLRNHKFELKADWIAGFLLGKLAIENDYFFPVEDIDKAMKAILSYPGLKSIDYTDDKKYPAIQERINHTLAGYFEASTQNWQLDQTDGNGNPFRASAVGGQPIVKISFPSNITYVGYFMQDSRNKRNPVILRNGLGVMIFNKLNNASDISSDIPFNWSNEFRARYIGNFISMKGRDSELIIILKRNPSMKDIMARG